MLLLHNIHILWSVTLFDDQKSIHCIPPISHLYIQYLAQSSKVLQFSVKMTVAGGAAMGNHKMLSLSGGNSKQKLNLAAPISILAGVNLD